MRGRDRFAALAVPRPRTPNQAAAVVTALAVVAVAAWSARPLDGALHHRLGEGGQERLLLAPMQSPVLYEGFGAAEPWGRWTIGETASITFGRPLSSRVAVTVHGHAFGPNVGQPVRLCLGKECQSAVFTGETTAVRVLFEHNSTHARRVVIHVPHPTAPGTADTRRLGLGVASIEAFEQ